MVDEKLGLAISIGAHSEGLSPEWEARRYFIHLLMSDWRQRLGKCGVCKQYFVRKPARKRYQNGFVCSSAHNRIQTAIKATQRRRTRVESRLVERAAALLHRRNVRTPGWLSRQTTKEWLAAELRAYLFKSRDPDLVSYRKSVRLEVHWVTRHQESIEQCRRGLKARRPSATERSNKIADDDLR